MWVSRQAYPSYPRAARRRRLPPAFDRRGTNGAARCCTTRRLNAHITSEQRVLYDWHPWAGRIVTVHSVLDKASDSVARCSLAREATGLPLEVPVSCAIEVRHRKPGTKLDNRKDGRYAGRVRLAVVLDRSAESLCGFVESTVAPGSLIVTDDWSGYAGLGKRGYEHFAVAECGDPEVAEQYLPIIHLVFANLKTWLIGIHHGVSHQHLQAYLNEFTFRFNRRFYPFNAFRSLLGIAGDTSAPTYAELYSGECGTLHVAVMGVNRIGKVRS